MVRAMGGGRAAHSSLCSAATSAGCWGCWHGPEHGHEQARALPSPSGACECAKLHHKLIFRELFMAIANHLLSDSV